ncbi:MAG: hypothetical protein ACFE9R_20575 [Candidatus Hermodarchaeota archaeon]
MELIKVRQELIIDLREDLPDLVDKFNHFILAPFKSKKNTVVNLSFNRATETLPKEMVVKIFRTINSESEYQTILRLKHQNLNIPDIIFYKTPYLFLKKIEGVNICDYINDQLKGIDSLDDLEPKVKENIVNCVEKLAEWLANLHLNNIVKKTGDMEYLVLNKGDTRLRDFIFNPKQNIMYGVDFEDSYAGNHIDDLAWICCSLLDTNPGIFDVFEPKPKIELINVFLKKYYNVNSSFQFDFNYFTEKLIEDLNIVMERRNFSMKLSKESFLEKISKEI